MSDESTGDRAQADAAAAAESAVPAESTEQPTPASESSILPWTAQPGEWSAPQQFGDGQPTRQYPSVPYTETPQNGAPGYGTPQYGQYDAPQYGTPQYGQYGAPQYGAPQYGPPQYGPPRYGAPQYGPPQLAGQHPAGEQFWTNSPQYWTPPAAAAPRKSRRRLLVGSIAAAAVIALTVGTVAVAVERANRNSSQQTALTSPNSQPNGSSQDGTGGTGSNGGGQFGFGTPFGGSGSGGSGSGGSGSGGSGSSTTGTATTTQQVGVVDINTVLDYGTGKAAGTGLVLSSSGQILTNNHVVDGSTSISVVVVSTGKTYTATLVGTDPTDDVAVLQLKDASGLAVANIGDSTNVAVGDTVTAVGNAGGTGGTPSSANGRVPALDQSIPASDPDGSNSESLTGMIQTDADIQAGDSGGPLYNSKNEVIGIDTAASTSRSTSTVGFAIPIAKATSIARQILSGVETSSIHIGYPAFLGVQLSSSATGGTSAGATIAGTVSGSAAAKAGLVAGDTITAVNGTAVSSASELSTVMKKLNPGDQVSVRYTDAAGSTHSASLTLGSGPAD
ncbi:hypothetical protein BH10ACT8_BH10ACT8_18680 [soil metagenome]